MSTVEIWARELSLDSSIPLRVSTAGQRRVCSSFVCNFGIKSSFIPIVRLSRLQCRGLSPRCSNKTAVMVLAFGWKKIKKKPLVVQGNVAQKLRPAVRMYEPRLNPAMFCKQLSKIQDRNRLDSVITNASVRHRLLETTGWGEDAYKAVVKGVPMRADVPRVSTPFPLSAPIGSHMLTSITK